MSRYEHCPYCGAAVVQRELEPGGDAVEARFFALDELPADIAFESHRAFIEKMKEKRGRNERLL